MLRDLAKTVVPFRLSPTYPPSVGMDLSNPLFLGALALLVAIAGSMMLMPEPPKSRSSAWARSRAGRGSAAGPALKFLARDMMSNSRRPPPCASTPFPLSQSPRATSLGMLPRKLPPGTTLRSLIEVLLPEDHVANVPPDAGEGTVSLRFADGPSYLLRASGNKLTVTETPRVADAPLMLSVRESTAQLFLDDWMGPQKLAPSFEPHGLTSITDARFLRKVSSVKGVLSLTLDDFEGHAATLLIAAGPDASVYDDPDAEIHIKLPAFLQILAGKLGPDEAIADGHVTLTGKKLVAMQFALAVAPYFPPRPASGAKTGRG